MFLIIFICIMIAVFLSYILSNKSGGGFGFFDIFKFLIALSVVIGIVGFTLFG